MDNGIIVGEQGTIIRTTNGGENWSACTSNTTEYLYSVCFSDVSNGWVAGGKGTILKTTDSGITWNPQNSGTTDNLLDVCFINSDIGFAACRYDVLLKTTDGGTTWSSQIIDDIYYSNISFIDSNNVLIVNRSSILHTKDGGQNWIPQKIGTTNSLYGVSKTGNCWIVVGDNGAMLRSSFGEVGIEDKNEIPATFGLNQNYPNPLNPETKISYSTPRASFITLKIYDILGKEVAALVNEEKPAGSYEVEFNAEGLSSGIYFYQLQAGEFTETKKMVLLR
ncbi:MAG: YCF48-related protein [Ignavibacteriaceae bacterium]